MAAIATEVEETEVKCKVWHVGVTSMFSVVSLEPWLLAAQARNSARETAPSPSVSRLLTIALAWASVSSLPRDFMSCLSSPGSRKPVPSVS